MLLAVPVQLEWFYQFVIGCFQQDCTRSWENTLSSSTAEFGSRCLNFLCLPGPAQAARLRFRSSSSERQKHLLGLGWVGIRFSCPVGLVALRTGSFQNIEIHFNKKSTLNMDPGTNKHKQRTKNFVACGRPKAPPHLHSLHSQQSPSAFTTPIAQVLCIQLPVNNNRSDSS